jgi:hypothetical protein
MMAPVAEARMAHSPSFNRSYSNPPSRLAYERPWIIVLAAVAIFVFYVVSGNYSFTRPLTSSATSSSDTAPAIQSETSSASQSALIAPISQTSSTRLSSDTSATTQFASTIVNPAPAVDEAETAIETQTATIETKTTAAATPNETTADTTAPAQDAAATQPIAEAADAAPVAAAPLTAATLTERWAAYGIVIVTDGQAWDETSLSNVDTALSILPPSVLSQLGNPALGQMHILVNGEGRSMSGSQPYGGAANYFSTNDGINELVLYPDQHVATVLHELGHAYNLRNTPAGHYAQVLVDPEMESFLAATGWIMLTPRETVATMIDHTQVAFDYEGSFRWHELSHFDPLEDFANAFAVYYADPDTLQAESPERYDWMAAHLPR